MLRIRKEQMEAFKNDILQKFEDRMSLYLRSQFPEKTQKIQEPELRQMIHAGTFQAQKYKVTLEPDVCRFLECMMVHGVNFDTDPKTAWAGKILRNERMTGRGKMDRIDDYEISMLRGA
jgi:hypothetical protein